MIRGNTLLENISKLNTFVHTIKSNEFLSIYIEKIINNKSKSIKFINDFDYISLDLLYTSLQIMNSKENITKEQKATQKSINTVSELFNEFQNGKITEKEMLKKLTEILEQIEGKTKGLNVMC